MNALLILGVVELGVVVGAAEVLGVEYAVGYLVALFGAELVKLQLKFLKSPVCKVCLLKGHGVGKEENKKTPWEKEWERDHFMLC